MKKGTIIGCMAFTGPKGEDTKKIAKNWPFEEPKLNNMESYEKRNFKKINLHKKARRKCIEDVSEYIDDNIDTSTLNLDSL